MVILFFLRKSTSDMDATLLLTARAKLMLLLREVSRRWCNGWDSNPQALDLKSDALTTTSPTLLYNNSNSILYIIIDNRLYQIGNEIRVKIEMSTTI